MSTTERERFEKWAMRNSKKFLQWMTKVFTIMFAHTHPQQRWSVWKACAESKQAEIDKLRAELEEYRNMEPYGVMFPESDMGIGFDRRYGNVLWFKSTSVRVQTELFAHPPKEKTE